MECDSLTTRQRTEVSLHYNWPLRPERSRAVMEEQSARICISLWAVHCPTACRIAPMRTERFQIKATADSNSLPWGTRVLSDSPCGRVLCALLMSSCHPPGPRTAALSPGPRVLSARSWPAASPAQASCRHLLSPLSCCNHPFHCWSFSRSDKIMSTRVNLITLTYLRSNELFQNWLTSENHLLQASYAWKIHILIE